MLMLFLMLLILIVSVVDSVVVVIDSVDYTIIKRFLLLFFRFIFRRNLQKITQCCPSKTA